MYGAETVTNTRVTSLAASDCWKRPMSWAEPVDFSD
jgi:hypothetical protein